MHPQQRDMQKDIFHNSKKLLTRFLNKMSEKILVPVLGESITEATVAKWWKNKGDNVQADAAIVELATDKVSLEAPSPISGTLSAINAQNGDVVEVGSMLGLINEGEKKVEEKKVEVKDEVKKTTLPKKNNVVNLDVDKKKDSLKIFNDIDEKKNLKEQPLVLTTEIKEKKYEKQKETNQNLSPAVRKIVLENKIDIEEVEGSGKDGRILKGDLISMMGAIPQSSERKIK